MSTPRAKIEQTAREIHAKILRGQKPSVRIPLRALSNVRYRAREGYFELKGDDKERTLTYNTVKTFAQMLRMMAQAKELVVRRDIATKREMYYISKNWGECRFNEQAESDTVMDDLEAMFKLHREQLGFVPEEKGGSVAGRLIVIDRDPATSKPIRIDCTKFGSGAYSVPVSVEELKFETCARFILAIECAGMFQRLVNYNFARDANCILISMGGVPTRACRRFIRRLSESANIPVYAFVDCDPYGICNIYRTLKVGSGNAAHVNEFFCVPNATYLGVTPKDIKDYDLPTHPLKPEDIKRAEDALKNDPFIQHHKAWQEALQLLLHMGVRAEQQALAAHGLDHVVRKYLPDKLKATHSFLP